MCADCQAARGHGGGPYPVMTRAQMRACLELLPTWALEHKAAANRQVVAVMRKRLAAGKTVARMYQEPALACLERQAQVAEELIAERQPPNPSAPGRRAPSWPSDHTRTRPYAPSRNGMAAAEGAGTTLMSLWRQPASRSPATAQDGTARDPTPQDSQSGLNCGNMRFRRVGEGSANRRAFVHTAEVAGSIPATPTSHLRRSRDLLGLDFAPCDLGAASSGSRRAAIVDHTQSRPGIEVALVTKDRIEVGR